MSQSVADLIGVTTRTLTDAGVENAPREARLLVAAAMGLEAGRLTLHLNDKVDLGADQHLGDLLSARMSRRPLSHVLGRRAFFEHEFLVTPDVLDPRPETELLVSLALAGRVNRVLDIGTGSGAILLSILAARPLASGLGTDISKAALSVAAKNAERIGVAARLELKRSCWFGAVTGTYDLIVSNPPYIALDEMPDLAPELAFEPRIALTDEADGLSAYREIAKAARDYLTPKGRLLVEIGWKQGEAVSAIFEGAGLLVVAIHPDLDGRDRVVEARLPR